MSFQPHGQANSRSVFYNSIKDSTDNQDFVSQSVENLIGIFATECTVFAKSVLETLAHTHPQYAQIDARMSSFLRTIQVTATQPR